MHKVLSGRSIVGLAAAIAISIAAGGTPSLHAGAQSEIVFAANDAPATSGEIYAVTFDGRQIDLTKSPARDDAPTVSPDGKMVAFMSVRGGQLAAYTVRLDGSGLRRVSPFLGSVVTPSLFTSESISWSPNGRQLAVQLFDVSMGQVYVVDADGTGWHAVSSPKDIVVSQAKWSPDGRRLLFVGGSKAGTGVRVVSTRGGASWSASGASATWSASGRLVVEAAKNRLAVYDASGRRLASLAGTWAAWSPDGRTLATLTASGGLSVRAGGTGPARIVGAAFNLGFQTQNDEALEWIGNTTVAVSDGFTWTAVEPATHRAVILPHLFAQTDSVLSADGGEAAVAVSGKSTSTLEVQAGRASPIVVQKHDACGFESPYENIQFVPGARSLVYESGCADAPGGLFAIAPDGSGLHRLTAKSIDANQPSLSPDGSTLAFVERASPTCVTCADSIWLAHADGSVPHQLVASPQKLGALYDDSPSFSPDGSEILFAQSTSAPGGLALFPNNSRLFETQVAGGQPTALGVAGSSPTWGPHSIAYTNDQGAIAVAHPDGTDPTTVDQGGQHVGGTAAWSSDGRLALLGTSGASAWIVLSTGTTINLPHLQIDPAGGGLAWSPDGTRLAFGADDDEGIADVWIVNADGTDLHRLTHDVGASLGVAWR